MQGACITGTATAIAGTFDAISKTAAACKLSCESKGTFCKYYQFEAVARKCFLFDSKAVPMVGNKKSAEGVCYRDANSF
jgi:hypothetical protein